MVTVTGQLILSFRHSAGENAVSINVWGQAHPPSYYMELQAAKN